jgi:bifunctional oligoribonuclease and PAP phosphatase NrnA
LENWKSFMVQNSKNQNKKLSVQKQIQNCWKEVEKAKKITILTHFRPDGDAISASAAISSILEKMGKKIETVYPSKPEFVFKRQPKNIFINKHKQTPDLIFILDTANYERAYLPKEFANIPSINIDHHVSNQIKSQYNFIDTNASSSCEILFTFIDSWNHKLIDEYTAECLLFGILSDSQVFHTQATTPKTLQISAKLMEAGANLYKLKTELISNKDPKVIALWGKILSNIKVTKKGKAAWAYLTQEDLKKYKITLQSLVGFNNFLSQIADIDVTLFFYQTESGKTKVSLRSKKTDVNKLAAKFKGGGHKNAAGILTDKPMDEMIKKITALL